MAKEILEKRQRKEEIKNERRSALITGSLVVVLLIFSLFWTAFSGPVPPIEDEQYITTGRIDFGNWTEGSSNVNNFQDPSPIPNDKPKSQENPQPQETQPVESVSTVTEKVASPDAKTETTVKTTESNAKTDNATSNTESQEVKETENKTPDTESMFELTDDESGGSNHGDGNETGNRGRDDTRVLDPNGSYSFGDGGNGNLNGRIPKELPQPRYTAAQDAKLTFEFVIAPNGTVKYVKMPMTQYDELANAGKEAIYKWRFNDIRPSTQEQRTRVTITFFRK